LLSSVQTLWAEKIQSTTDARSLNTFGQNEIEVAPISSALLRIACLVILYKLPVLVAVGYIAIVRHRLESKVTGSNSRAKPRRDGDGSATDDDLDVINGRQEQLEGKIQERYGFAKDQAKKDVEDWFNSLP
jgi:uncharacterized protein YjbJ (UPF0337 family)